MLGLLELFLEAAQENLIKPEVLAVRNADIHCGFILRSYRSNGQHKDVMAIENQH